MTQFQHSLVAIVISTVIYHLFLKDYFYDEEEHQWWMKFCNRFF